MKFGSKSTTEILEDGVSTKTEKDIYYEGKRSLRKVRYEIHHRIPKGSLVELENLAVSLFSDPKKLDPALLQERTRNGDKEDYYKYIECYTLLEY